MFLNISVLCGIPHEFIEMIIKHKIYAEIYHFYLHFVIIKALLFGPRREPIANSETLALDSHLQSLDCLDQSASSKC